MTPILPLLSDQALQRIIQEGFALLEDPGVIINHPEALTILAAGGAHIDQKRNLACLPEEMIQAALAVCPRSFSLFNLSGQEALHYGSDRTYFTPGSSALRILDSESKQIRSAISADLVKLTKVVEGLPQIAAQSTAIVSSDVPQAIQDLYRLYIALSFQSKPIITGVFQHDSWQVMLEMLTIAAGDRNQLIQKPLAVFDICPTSPLQWSYTSAQNLLDNARSGIPIQIIPMPLGGATAPVTLAGTLVQATAEALSGIVLAQDAHQGAPLVWGISPAVFDMKNSTPALGSGASWLLAGGYAQIGRSLGLPTQAYLGISDSKLVDAQAGLESGISTLLGALFGFSMVSGAGMLASENCQSFEKLVLDAELIGQINHFQTGLPLRESPLGLDLIREIGQQGDFITHDHTLRWFKEVQHYPTALFDRQQIEAWTESGSQDAWQRAGERVAALLADYPGPVLDKLSRQELRRLTGAAAKAAGMEDLPELEG